MEGGRLQNLISKGMGVGARRLGKPFIVYRPRAVCQPLASRNRVIKLYCAFNAQDERFRRVAGYGGAVWWGVFDSLYTRAGDYLLGTDPCGNRAVFFVSAQQPLLPAQCVRTNCVVRVLRPPPPAQGGYGGFVSRAAVQVIEGWPASVLSQGAHVPGTLPETRFGNWVVLLPHLPTQICVGDVVADDTGRTFLIAAAEQSDMGWRIIARQVTA
jgi:hypothetical protein